jgi:hypothetical protein
MSHVGWKIGQTALYYMKLAEDPQQSSPSCLLSLQSDESLESLQDYANLNSLKNFVSAFPSHDTCSLQSASLMCHISLLLVLDCALELSLGFEYGYYGVLLDYSYMRCPYWYVYL